MKKSLYLRFLENEKAKENKDLVNEVCNIKENSYKTNNTIVVLNYISNLVVSILKVLMYILAFVLISIGITAIVNPSIRGIFLNLF